MSVSTIGIIVGAVALSGGLFFGMVMPWLSRLKTPTLDGLQSPKDFAACSKELVNAYETAYKAEQASQKEIQRLKAGALAVLQVSDVEVAK